MISPSERTYPNHADRPSSDRRDMKNPWRVYEQAKRRIRREASDPEDYERRLRDLLEYLQL